MIIEIVGNKLDSYSIRELMRYSSNRDLTKNLLLKNGISKDEINNSIRMYRIETDPIP
jgi:translation initiation factor 2 beta subunit (eIF-2beta)/eIF-5